MSTPKLLDFDKATTSALYEWIVAESEPTQAPSNGFALAYRAELEQQAQVAVREAQRALLDEADNVVMWGSDGEGWSAWLTRKRQEFECPK